jgi:Putative transposase.
MFDAMDFLAELTQHIPPKGTQLIRRYGLYSSRIKGRWEEMDYIAERAPQGWRAEHDQNVGSDQEPVEFSPFPDSEGVCSLARKSAWARLLARVYEVDPLVCPACGSQMKVIAVIQDIDEIKHILRHLIKIGRAPPGLNESSVN